MLERLADRINNLLPTPLPLLQVLLILGLMYIVLVVIRYFFRQSQTTTVDEIFAEADKKRDEAESKVQKLAGNNVLIWQASYFQQQKYLDINIEQNNYIYRMTVRMIMFGFFLICIGVILGILNLSQASPNISLTAIIAGVLTQFIAGTILVVFKLVLHQTTEYFKAVERMTHIGVAMNILDELPSGGPAKDLKRNTQVALAKVIIEGQYGFAHTNRHSP